MTQDSRSPSPIAQGFDPAGRLDRLEVLRCAEQWQGLILELEFHTWLGRRGELESFIWKAVREMVLTTQPGQ